ncbi:MAG: response regulator transcription factor [Rhodobacteraceae bacterium]|nr:response regulator transcription factor [Paracoccaceae bacterium]
MENKTEKGYILIVDDSPEELKFLTDVVEASGASVLVALNGAKALEVIDEIVPDAILMDAVMPEMGGFETCRMLKKNSLMRHVPVIFMTGLSETEHIVEGFQAGGVDYLVKPIAPDELIARMRVHLSNAKLAQSAYVAMDEAKRFLLATNANGEILWSTPQARKLIQGAYPNLRSSGVDFPKFVVKWLGELSMSGPHRTSQLVLLSTDKRQLLVSYIGQNGPDEFLLRVIEDCFLVTQNRLSDAFGLTMREAEVLAWIANGKTNRDIGAILDLSPRTINKHLERVHQKLGVETRTAAAAAAFQVL